ncbi:MAG: DUF1405 domain-containing protein [Negativicutes bacterium]|nr:DUF1405 domain-containing protein [Negativicutes bacterium]
MRIFSARWFLIALVCVNLVGTVWGVLWYWEQLQETPWYLLPVVPDSPLHAMLFGIFIFWLLANNASLWTPWRSFIAWAGALGVVKYGLWTTVILSQYLLAPGSYPVAQDWMLYASHGGMALQGLVYMDKLPQKAAPAAWALLWFALNDFCDYVLMTHPRLPLPDQVAVAGWTGITLTVLVALLALKTLWRKDEAVG